VEFIGPEWMNPLVPHTTLTNEEIAQQMQLTPILHSKGIPAYNLPASLVAPTVQDSGGEVPATKKKPNLMLPIAGAAAAALGIYAATR
jgi:hypothetical protein